MTRPALLLSCAGAITLPLAGATTDPIAVARLALCGAALGAIAAIDLAEHRIANRLVVPATAACAALSLIDGVWITALLTGLAIVGALLPIALARPAMLGMGDVKAALLIVVGLDGDASRALAGLIVIARSGRGAGRRALPLAPFLALGSLLVLLP